MANGTDSDEFVDRSRVRQGLKREWSFALSQADVCCSLGRTRARKAHIQALPEPKRLKMETNTADKSDNVKGVGDSEAVISEEDVKSDVVDVVASDEERNGGFLEGEVVVVVAVAEKPLLMYSWSGPRGKRKAENDEQPNVVKEEDEEAKKEKIETEQASAKLEILDLVEKGGDDKVECEKPLRRYTRSTLKQRKQQVSEDEMQNVALDMPIDVDEPNVGDSVTDDEPKQDEVKNSEPEKPLVKLEILNLIQKGDTMEHKVSETLPRRFTRSALKSKNGGQDVNTVSSVRVEIKLVKTVKKVKFSDAVSILELNETEAKLSVTEKPSDAANNLSELPKMVSIATSPDTVKKCPDTIPECQDTIPQCPGKISRCHETDSKFLATISELPDSSTKSRGTVLKSKSPGSKSRGRVTKKDLGMHKLVFEVLEDGTELSYIHNGQILAVGYKKGSGMVCKCHEEEVSPSQFEAHAGCSTRRKPYHNIFISNGVSLHELALELSKNRKLSNEDNDDLCQICKKGGKVICCNSCPRVYHTGCLSLRTVPKGSWYCNHCQAMFDKQKDADNHVNAVAAGRVPGIDPMEQITNRCIRIISACDQKLGGCSLCSGHEFKDEGFGPGTVILFDQCEREFHIGCLKENGIVDLKEVPTDKWFCHPACLRKFSALQKLVVHGQQKLPDSLLNIIKQKRSKKGPPNGGLDVKWRVLSGKSSTGDESSELLSKALAIFHDQFAPIIDKETGLDFIKEMLYGGTIKTQEFGGMHCAIITVNDSVVSAAMFRIYGTSVAELPLVATSADHQGQGYFQILFSCIERFLAFLAVDVLLLPAAAEAVSIWTKKFGFGSLNQSEIHEYRKQYPILIFDGTSVLRKPVPKCRITNVSKAKTKTNVESS